MDKYGWINGRETKKSSGAYGEVVVNPINVLSDPRKGDIQKVFELQHGEKVSIEGEYKDVEKSILYKKIEFNNKSGWVPNSMVSEKWSQFVFIGSISPMSLCKSLKNIFEFNGYSINVFKDNVSIGTNGDPEEFDSLLFAIKKIVQIFSFSQSLINQFPIEFIIHYWVEMGLGKDSGRNVVGKYLPPDNDSEKIISQENLQSTLLTLPQAMTFQHLFLSLNDYYQSLNFPQHALIFLARAIETIENYFGYFYCDGDNNLGKEKTTQKLLGISATKVKYVTSRANRKSYHSRHASQYGKVDMISNDELNKCFQKTKEIILAFDKFLFKGKMIS